MIFSLRYLRAIEHKRIAVDISLDPRKKLWSWLTHHDASLGIQRDPNDRWISNSSILEEVQTELMTEHGWDEIPGAPSPQRDNNTIALRHLVLNGPSPFVLDALELAYRWMDKDAQETFRNKINQVFEIYECPWRLSDGEFFKLDGDFVGARLAETAHDALARNSFAGAAEEYAKSRQEFASGDVKDAIFHAGKSFESVLKVITGLEHANADRLIKAMVTQGYFDDLPESIRSGFADQVMKALPFLRNKLGGHGQGATVVEIPAAYGELAIQLAAAVHNFLIAKHLRRQPPKQEQGQLERTELDDEIPF